VSNRLYVGLTYLLVTHNGHLFNFPKDYITLRLHVCFIHTQIIMGNISVIDNIFLIACGRLWLVVGNHVT